MALIGGLCHAADFNQMWPKMCPLLEVFVTQRALINVAQNMPLIRGLCHTVNFDQMWSKHVPFNGGLCFVMGFDHIWIDNVLIIEKGRYLANGF